MAKPRQSYDDSFFLQSIDNEDTGRTSAYLNAWPVQTELRGLQYPTYLNEFAFEDASYQDPCDNVAPVSFVAPSQVQMIPSPPQMKCPVDIQEYFVNNRFPSAPQDMGQIEPGQKLGAAPRTRASPTINPPELAPCMSTQPASSRSNNKPGTKSKDDRRPKVTRTRSKRSQSGSGSACEEEDSADLKAKHNHSVIERRYRDNLNGKITHLHRTLQAAEANSRLTGFEGQYSDPGRRVRKCDIMSTAIHYVHQSEVEIRHMTEEIQRLQERVRGLEKLVKCEDCTLLQNLRRLQLEKAY
ncbi:bHLH/Zip transcription factor [Exophiala xenobiotica]|nr:bHLH/Zip transcription factor [Exophiala xenobiotica]KAK5215902.1 bHLH/Zip transcription factor [Exophiala xenobiotica]KAK5219336.1 bHLH/Zip transcription factor [Exophiala xenobiotica]KAK5245926.1 bHLH/Zip transcription factor [Exophiala xenobiotica]KAK5261504.1 hypothetical protein LTR40_002090 [Exophiala xenobiotica]